MLTVSRMVLRVLLLIRSAFDLDLHDPPPGYHHLPHKPALLHARSRWPRSELLGADEQDVQSFAGPDKRAEEDASVIDRDARDAPEERTKRRERGLGFRSRWLWRCSSRIRRQRRRS
jgi:hypothetical protein